MATAIKGFKLQGKISEHDEKIGKKLAYILTGGDQGGLTRSVDEQYLLDIERDAFISLAAEPLSQDRMRFMLKKGKPLRN
jgi:3-hydroxyacyl-CoA dehydrogenase